MTIAILPEVQEEVSQILVIKPHIKEEVQGELRDVLREKPDIQNIEELVDWKIQVWEKQYETDHRIQALFHCLSEDEILNFYDTVILNPYIPVVPFWNQILLLFTPGSTLYGGARGGGKTEASLIGALQYVEFQQWKVGIFRLTYPDLSVPGAIMDRAKDWLKDNPLLEDAGLAPHWNSSEKIFTFPSGSKIMFGHVQHEKDADKYQGSEFHLLILDEAVQFTVNKITKLKGSNRKQFNDPLPLRKWYTGNPGGVSHDYFKELFIDGSGNFIDSKYSDNPYLDHKAYEAVFEEIKDSDPILYRQWKLGDWNAIPEGKIYKRSWFTDRLYTVIHEKIIKWLRFWDLAATKADDDHSIKGGSDWTVGMLLGLTDHGRVYLDDIVRSRKDPDGVIEDIVSTAKNDLKNIKERGSKARYLIRVEQEGGSSGKIVISYLAKDLAGFDFDGETVPRKSKIDRARAFVSFVKHGHLRVRDGESWLTTFLNEITVFPTKGVHDDQMDALSGGLKVLIPIDEGEREIIPGFG